MANLALMVWNEEEAAEHATSLRAAGHHVDAFFAVNSSIVKHVRAAKPQALVIDLNRLPSTGTQVALAIRNIPIVFIEGDVEKTAKAKAKVPAATYTTWKKLPALLKRVDTLIPSASSGSAMDVYKETPVASKLGLDKARTIVAIDAPRVFLQLLPPHVEVVEEHQPSDSTFCFAISARELQARIESLAARAPIWIAWPKRSTKNAADLNMYSVREIAFGAGLVDYKICGIDQHWSAMLFTRRRTK